MRGDLSETPVADLCRGLSAAGATGAVEVADHAGDARIFFRAGDVYWAISPTPRARLGDRLVNGGLLTQEQLDETLESQRASSERTKLGALLVERGLVSRDAIRVFVQEQILDALFEMMGWHEGSYVFNPGEVVDEKLPVDIPVDQLLVEVSRRQSEWDRISEAIPDLDMIPDFVTGGSSAHAALEPDEFTVLANVDGGRTIRDLAEDLGYSEFEAARIVYGLTLLGIVAVRHGDDDEADETDEADEADEADARTDADQRPVPGDADDGPDIDVGTALEEALAAAGAGAGADDVPASGAATTRPSVKLHVDDEVRDYLPPHGPPAGAPAADEGEPGAASDAEVREPEPWVADGDATPDTGDDDLGFFAGSGTGDAGADDGARPATLDDDDFDALLDELAAPLHAPAAGGEAAARDLGGDDRGGDDRGGDDRGGDTHEPDDHLAWVDRVEAPDVEAPADDATDESAADEPTADEPTVDEPAAHTPAGPPPEPERAAGEARRGGGTGGDVSEFLRELSQLAIDEPPASSNPGPSSPRQPTPDTDAREPAAPTRGEERRQAEERREREAANKKRGLFGWGR